MLVLSRGSGKGVWIGKDITITVLDKVGSERWLMRVDAISTCNVSDMSKTYADHVNQQMTIERLAPNSYKTHMITLAFNERMLIGRGISITLLGDDQHGAKLGIDAPRYLAVSRDDFSRDEHLAFQLERDNAYFPKQQ